MKKLETGNIGIGNTSTLATFNKMIAIVALLAVGGCKMKEFSSTPLYSGDEVKFTGAVEDRVNLWPLAYWREPVGSIVWPVVSWGDDHLAFRPVWSQYKRHGYGEYDEFNLFWPICQFDTYKEDYRVFPFFWGSERDGDDSYFCLFPALWWNDDFKGVLPFWWMDNADSFGIFPLYWHINIRGSLDMLFPLYGYWPGTSSNGLWAFCGLAGYERQDGELANHRILPLYLWSKGNFYSIPYSRYENDDRTKSRILCGLAGANSSTNGEYEASWLFPLYYHDTNKLITPLFGKSGDYSWAMPLYYNDDELFLTMLYGRNKKDESDWLFPLFYRDKESFVTPLFGKSRDSEWLFPLYMREKNSIYTIPYGRQVSGAYTNTYFAAGLAGVKSGKEEGGWLFPLFDYEKRADFDEKIALLDAKKLPTREKHFWSHDKRTHLLVSDNDRWVYGDDMNNADNTYKMTYKHKMGNRLLFRRETKRRVKFDLATRARVSDTEEGWHSFLWLVYQHDWNTDAVKGTSKQCHNVLWKLWDWKEENGNIALDVFPGFTYDSKTNGYVKTSLLWRLFRYENDPEKDRKIDFLFVPVWR